MEKHLKRRPAIVKPDEVFDYYEIDAADLKHIEDTVEQNDNNFDGIINNTPTVDELEAKVKAGETISLVDLANAVKADKERGKEAKPEKKPSIRAQLRADKEKAQKKNAKQKLQDLERS